MCNCLAEKAKGIKEKLEFEYVYPPIELISGRAYLNFTAKKTGKKKEERIPLLLSNCPICGEKYQ